MPQRRSRHPISQYLRSGPRRQLVSREPVQPVRPPERNYYRTGRDVQFNTKVTRETKEGFDTWAKKTGRPLGEILERALGALDREKEAEEK